MSYTFRNHHSGFTLIEVMVALTIIAISLGALLSTSGTQANSATYLKQKTLAHWVALNELAEIDANDTFPDTGEKKGSTSMANHDWYWIRKTTKLADSNNRREVVFTVFSDKNYEYNLTTLTGYAHAPKQTQ
ncbi:MAG: type II secretion system minor pseudopilin GspI [Gammaproteobacteria bacterium]|nr:type II secretion system minor pseudopilin GspI [Gammaproteobacteria bacterium]